MRRFLFVILALLLIQPQLPSIAQTDELMARETMRIGRGTIRHVEWHPDGDLILVDTASGACLFDDTRFPQGDYTLQWSDDGTHLAIGGEGVVSVWDVGTLRPHND